MLFRSLSLRVPFSSIAAGGSEPLPGRTVPLACGRRVVQEGSSLSWGLSRPPSDLGSPLHLLLPYTTLPSCGSRFLSSRTSSPGLDRTEATSVALPAPHPAFLPVPPSPLSPPPIAALTSLNPSIGDHQGQGKRAAQAFEREVSRKGEGLKRWRRVRAGQLAYPC